MVSVPESSVCGATDARFRDSFPMALLYELVWQLLLCLLQLQRAGAAWLRGRVWRRGARLGRRAGAALLLLPEALGQRRTPKPRRVRPGVDAKTLEKLPVHVGLLVAEEEQQYTDIANLVVWCMAVGISYVSVYDNEGKTQY